MVTLTNNVKQSSITLPGYEPANLVNNSLIWIYWQLRLKSHLFHLATQRSWLICDPFTKPIE
jgi:hypothetical protein